MTEDIRAQHHLPFNLLASARAEFHAHGFEGANVGRIAAAAGMSKKTVYKYVRSKEALMFEVLRAVISQPGVTLRGVVDASTPAEFLTAYLTAFATLAFSDEGVASYRLMMREGTRFPAVAHIYVDTVRTFGVGPLAEQLMKYAKSGALVVPDPARAATMVIAMTVADVLRDAALGLVTPPSGCALDTLVGEVVGIFLGGTKPPGGQAA